MEVVGKIVRVFEPQQGVSKTGNAWKKREYLLEVPNGQYPTQIFFNFFGDRADQFVLTGGKEYRVSFDIQSREFNGRWYTDIRAWKAEEITGEAASMPSSSHSSYNTQAGGPSNTLNETLSNAPKFEDDGLNLEPSDELPF